jgi:hypothetical protein
VRGAESGVEAEADFMEVSKCRGERPGWAREMPQTLGMHHPFRNHDAVPWNVRRRSY